MPRVANDPPTSTPPSDVCLLLRAHAEQIWLNHELVPVLHQLEQRDRLSDEQARAALAYLEFLWMEASGRAAGTEAAYAELARPDVEDDRTLSTAARHYHAAVRGLREALARKVAALVARAGEVMANEHVSSLRRGNVGS